MYSTVHISKLCTGYIHAEPAIKQCRESFCQLPQTQNRYGRNLDMKQCNAKIKYCLSDFLPDHAQPVHVPKKTIYQAHAKLMSKRLLHMLPGT